MRTWNELQIMLISNDLWHTWLSCDIQNLVTSKNGFSIWQMSTVESRRSLSVKADDPKKDQSRRSRRKQTIPTKADDLGTKADDPGVKQTIFGPKRTIFWAKADDPWVKADDPKAKADDLGSKRTIFWAKADDLWSQSGRSYLNTDWIKADDLLNQSGRSYLTTDLTLGYKSMVITHNLWVISYKWRITYDS